MPAISGLVPTISFLSYKNPIILSANQKNAGLYSLTVSINGCNTSPVSVPVEVRNCSNTGINTDLSINKWVDESTPEINQEVVFTVKAFNNGPLDATGVYVSDLLPDGYSYISSVYTLGTYNESQGIWMIGVLKNGESQELTVRASVNPSGNYVNSAVIQGDINEVNIMNNISSTLTKPVTKDPVEPGLNELNIPNAFSPNGDGINDVFVIRGIYDHSTLIIFDRLGKTVYQSDDYQNDWNGTGPDGGLLKSDTYWYVLRMPGIVNDFKGFVYLKK